ncbi:MAG: hypothetical protein MUC77_10050 [Chromatiaceae bacterium]|nr:hypothetical protein [Chromatiaceae bacterium]
MWGPELLDPAFASRLDAVPIEDARLDRIDGYLRPYLRIAERRLNYGGRMLQFRLLFGSEQRNERAYLDSPLAQRVGLRTTNLQYRG